MQRFLIVLACLTLPAAAHAAEMPDQPILVLNAGGHTAQVSKIVFTPDGKQLISASYDRTIRVWDATTGECLRTLRLPIGNVNSWEGIPNAVAISPHGRTLAIGTRGGEKGEGANVYLVEFETGRILRILTGPARSVHSLAFSSDGKQLAAGDCTSVWLWEVSTGIRVLTLKGHKDCVNTIAFSPDGRKLASCSSEATMLWSVTTGGRLIILASEQSSVRTKDSGVVAWSPSGDKLLTGERDAIQIWSSVGKKLQKIKVIGHVQGLQFLKDPNLLLYSTSGAVSGEGCLALLNIERGTDESQLERDPLGFNEIALSPDGKTVASTQSFGAAITLWALSDGKKLLRLEDKARMCWSAGWSADGTRIAWGNSNTHTKPVINYFNFLNPLERTFHLQELEIGRPGDITFLRAKEQWGDLKLQRGGDGKFSIKQGTNELLAFDAEKNQRGEFHAFTFLSGSRAVVATCNELVLFDQEVKENRWFKGHTGHVWGLAASPDGRYFLSASADETLRIWQPDRLIPLLSFFFAGDEWIAWTPEGYYAASPGGEKLMGWHVNNGADQLASFYPADQFRKTLYRPDVIKLLLKTGSVEKALAAADKARGKATERTEVAKVLPPKAVILSPGKAGLQVHKPELEVKVEAQSVGGQSLRSVTLLLNGRPYLGQTGVRNYESGKRGTVTETWTVTLSPGKHKLQVQVESFVSRGYSEELEVIYVGEVSEQKLPALYILSIGVAEYKEDRLKLNYAAGDAKAIEQAFMTHSKPLFSKIDSKVLVDQDATRKEILRGLTWLSKQATQGDLAVIFYSGHGERDNRQNFYFLPIDVDLDELSATGISEGDFKKALEALPCKTLVLVDACHAGALGGDKRKAALTDDLIRDLNADIKGMAILCSSTGRELSRESNKHRRSVFTVALLEGLEGKQKNANGVVYFHHLESYIKDRVKELTNGEQHPTSNNPAEMHSLPLAKP